jgi:hypothetical protein
MVVGTQHQDHVFDRNDHGKGPKENGQNTVDIVWRERHVARAKDLFHGVQNTGANVAVNHANGTQRECGKRRFCCLH